MVYTLCCKNVKNDCFSLVDQNDCLDGDGIFHVSSLPYEHLFRDSKNDRILYKFKFSSSYQKKKKIKSLINDLNLIFKKICATKLSLAQMGSNKSIVPGTNGIGGTKMIGEKYGIE